MDKQHANAINVWLLVFSLRFSTKYRLVLYNIKFRAMLLFTGASRLIQLRSRKLFFIQGGTLEMKW